MAEGPGPDEPDAPSSGGGLIDVCALDDELPQLSERHRTKVFSRADEKVGAGATLKTFGRHARRIEAKVRAWLIERDEYGGLGFARRGGAQLVDAPIPGAVGGDNPQTGSADGAADLQRVGVAMSFEVTGAGVLKSKPGLRADRCIEPIINGEALIAVAHRDEVHAARRIAALDLHAIATLRKARPS